MSHYTPDQVITFAYDVMGKQATKWLSIQNEALDGERPFDLLVTQEGCGRVAGVLYAIVHGLPA